MSLRYHFFLSAKPETHGNERSSFCMGGQGTITPPKHKDQKWKKKILLFSLYPLPFQLLWDCWRGKACAGAGGTIAPLTAAPQPDISELRSPGGLGVLLQEWCQHIPVSLPLPGSCFCVPFNMPHVYPCLPVVSAGFTLTSSS